MSKFEFKKCDWQEHYPGAKEVLPPNHPKARGNAVSITSYVDASHAGDRVTRRSHTGVFIFLNRALVMWYSKRQNTVESSTFGSEFIALKTGVDLIEGLRYKLRMFGVPIDGKTEVLCDNESVVKNTTAPESTLKKKHTAIAYHRCREAVAAGVIGVGFVHSKEIWRIWQQKRCQHRNDTISVVSFCGERRLQKGAAAYHGHWATPFSFF